MNKKGSFAFAFVLVMIVMIFSLLFISPIIADFEKIKIYNAKKLCEKLELAFIKIENHLLSSDTIICYNNKTNEIIRI